MAKIKIAISQEFTVEADIDAVYSFLADTPATLDCYPKLQKSVDLGDDRWRWVLQPIGIKDISHQVVYSVQYSFDPAARRIQWTPLQEEKDNADIRGEFIITEKSGGTHVTLQTDGEIEIPAPKLLAPAIKPLVEREFKQQISDFIANLKKTIDT